MKITLTVEHSPDPSLQGASMSFDRSGGSLGRAAGNDWVLPDPNFYTSGRHAEIRLENDRFVVVDLSTNGTFHNSPDQLIGKHRSAPLNNGDRLYIGEFVMKIGLEQAEATAQAAALPSDEEDDLLLPDDDEPLVPPPSGTDRVAELEKDEFDELLEGPSQEPEADAGLADDDLPFASRRRGSLDLDDEIDESVDAEASTDSGRLSQSPEREYFAPPDVRREAQADEIPDEWDALLTGFFEPPANVRSNDADHVDTPSQSESELQSESARSAPRPDSDPDPIPEPELGRADAAASQRDPASESDASNRQPGGAVSPAPEPPRRPSPPRPAPRKPERDRPASVSRGGDDAYLLAAVLKELGIADQAGAVDPDDFAEQIGKVVRMVGEGLMQLLASRAEIKNEFRIDQTRIASSRNNPLKFSPSIEEAMRRVFVERDSPGFISGAEAFELALNDLRAHQMAILAAVQGAVESVIRQFNPEELERKLKKISPISASAPLIREAKCWNLFTSHYEEMASNLRHDAKKVFVREFAEAYERSSSEIARRIAEDRDASAS